jgi:hypothetical protein
MGIIVNDGDSQPANLSNFFVAKAKAGAVKNGDMVSWNSSGGMATGKIEHVSCAMGKSMFQSQVYNSRN